MGSGNDTFTYMAGTVSGGIDGGSGNNAMIFQSAAGQSTTFNADLKNFNSIRVESGDIVLSGLTITMELASLSQDSPLFTLSGSTSRETGPSLSFQDVTLQLLGTGNEACGAVWPNHSGNFCVDEAQLLKGAMLYAQVAMDFNAQ